MAGFDREYWLNFAKDSITASISNRVQAAERIDTFLLWLWGIYTTIFALASFLDLLSANTLQLIFTAQPILVIMLARFSCIYATLPVPIKADPAVVPQIIAGFSAIVRERERRLQVASIFAILSILSLSAALVGYNRFDPQKELKHALAEAKLQVDIQEKKVRILTSVDTVTEAFTKQAQLHTKELQLLLASKKLQMIRQKHLGSLDSLLLLEKKLKQVGPP